MHLCGPVSEATQWLVAGIDEACFAQDGNVRVGCVGFAVLLVCKL